MNQITETLSPQDLYLELEAFSQGRSLRAWQCMGAHPARDETGAEGWLFRTWAPNAPLVSLLADFNGWDPAQTPMERLEGGIWQVFVPGLRQYDRYQFAIHDGLGSYIGKADPYAFHADTRPEVSSKLYPLSGYTWGDKAWLAARKKYSPVDRPLNIYECHLGSWRRTGEGEFLSYDAIGDWLVPYVKRMGFTHVELLPVMEHPLDASWGYQVTGYFAATSRFGTPDDLRRLIDRLHQAGVGVILDWVPAHFPRDRFGLYHFDGGPTYEYADPRKGEHPEWGTNVFDFGRNEVRSFLMSSALFWVEQFHADGLRVDAVSSMLYLDYARQEGQWQPNVNGGRENLEAVRFLQDLNTAMAREFPDVMMIAEEATSWPKLTAPAEEGGLGFTLKWNMGWMNDICHYIKLDPYFRQFSHKDLTFSLMYAFSEHYVLPLSHDEVVHMKGSLFGKMPGDDAMKFAGVRAFYTYMLAHPGKKLIFMGAELGQWNEWHYEYSLDWHLLENQANRDIQHFFQMANALYLEQPALWQRETGWDGFTWLSVDDNTADTIAFLRWDKQDRPLAVVCNFSPVHRKDYRLGVPFRGRWSAIFNTDRAEFGGSGLGDASPLRTEDVPCHGQQQSLVIDLPPMSAVVWRCVRRFPPKRGTPAVPAQQGRKKTDPA